MSNFTTIAGVSLSFSFVLVSALPAYASTDSNIVETSSPQLLKTSDSFDNEIHTLSSDLEYIEEIVLPSVVPAAVSSNSSPTSSVSVPVSYVGGGILAAARSQIGIAQDCTAMVENALRMLGYSVGDLAPMDFAAYGVRVDPSQAQPGDIMMRGGHVSVYAGNNVAIHGGFGGSTVESSSDANPYGYAVIVRL